MQRFSDEDIRIERVWCGESIGTKLIIQHTLSGMTAERIIGFDGETQHKRELVAELSHRFSVQYPARDFIMEHLWCGPGKGASLRLRHTPSGITIDRVVGHDPVAQYHREMMVELFQRLRKHENGEKA